MNLRTAKPLATANARVTETDTGGRVTVPVKLRGIASWLFRLPADASRTFELDEMGMFIWRHCDGQTSVEQMIARMVDQKQLSRRETELAVVKFLHMLARRGLIAFPQEPPRE